MLAACDVRRRLCAHLKVALEDSLSKFVFHELMTPDANALILVPCAPSPFTTARGDRTDGGHGSAAR